MARKSKAQIEQQRLLAEAEQRQQEAAGAALANQLTTLLNQVDYLRKECAVLLQRVAAANVLAGQSWDSGTQMITIDMERIDKNLSGIAAQFQP